MLSAVFLLTLAALVYVLWHYVWSETTAKTDVASAQTLSTLDPSRLGSSANFTYGVWIFISDFEYRLGEHKIVLQRGGLAGSAAGASLDDDAPLFELSIAPTENTLLARIACMPFGDEVASPAPTAGHRPLGGARPAQAQLSSTSAPASAAAPHQTSPAHRRAHAHLLVSNVPLQRWVFASVSVFGRVADFYLDGKLVQSIEMPGVAVTSPVAPLLVTPGGGFYGWTSKVQYRDDASSPDQIWDAYRAGYGGSWVSWLFGRYTVKVSIMDGNSAERSVTL